MYYLSFTEIVFYLKNGGFLTLAGKMDPGKNQGESLFMILYVSLQYNIMWSTFCCKL